MTTFSFIWWNSPEQLLEEALLEKCANDQQSLVGKETLPLVKAAVGRYHCSLRPSGWDNSCIWLLLKDLEQTEVNPLFSSLFSIFWLFGELLWLIHFWVFCILKVNLRYQICWVKSVPSDALRKTWRRPKTKMAKCITGGFKTVVHKQRWHSSWWAYMPLLCKSIIGMVLKPCLLYKFSLSRPVLRPCLGSVLVVCRHLSGLMCQISSRLKVCKRPLYSSSCFCFIGVTIRDYTWLCCHSVGRAGTIFHVHPFPWL